MRTLLLVIGLVLGAPAVALAHGAVHQRIDEITARLRASPDDARLLDQRGALHAVDESWPAAATDFEAAHHLDPSLPGIEHRFANALLHAGDAERALVMSSTFLQKNPTHIDGHVVRARAHLALGARDAAVADLSRAIDLGDPPVPRYYLDRAKILTAAGPAGQEAALAGLNDGIERLGPIVALIEAAVDIESARGGDHQVLALIARLEGDLRRAPQWRATRAAALQRMGRLEEAETEYRDALAFMAELPESRRGSVAMRSVESQLRADLAAIVVQRSRERGWPGWLWALIVVAGMTTLAVRYRIARSARVQPVDATGRCACRKATISAGSSLSSIRSAYARPRARSRSVCQRCVSFVYRSRPRNTIGLT
jgi:tetratricopeptide (TPR) repeat protein